MLATMVLATMAVIICKFRGLTWLIPVILLSLSPVDIFSW